MCFESLIDHERKIGDQIVDDVSTEPTIQILKPTTSYREPNMIKLFSNKGGKRGMQRLRKEQQIEEDYFEGSMFKTTTRLSTLLFIQDLSTVHVLLGNVKTPMELLKVIDRMMITPGTIESCRAAITRTLQRINRPHCYQGKKHLLKLPIHDCVLFIELTPRGIVYIQNQRPSIVFIVKYDGSQCTYSLPHFHHCTESNRKSFWINWSDCGRYISLYFNDQSLFLFDSFSCRFLDSSQFNNFDKHVFTHESVKFLYRNAYAFKNPSLCLRNPEDVNDSRYYLSNSKVSYITVSLVHNELENHQKFKTIMGFSIKI